MNAVITRFRTLTSPIGKLLLAEDDGRLSGLWVGGERSPSSTWRRDVGPFGQCVEELEAYFAGERRTFTIPLAARGTPFQHGVWRALLGIAYGARTTYREVAATIGRPTAIRAVGAANGANPISVIVPCHRVIGSDGGLTGYGGGLAAKRWLLDHEERHT